MIIVECPKCGEIELNHVAAALDRYGNRLDEYQCRHCGHYETMANGKQQGRTMRDDEELDKQAWWEQLDQDQQYIEEVSEQLRER